jgi:manganese-dependent inorganic pyrophosphatase
MDEKSVRVLPVLRTDRTCQGLLSVFKMTQFFLPSPGRLLDSRRVLASIDNLARTLEARVIFAIHPEREEDLLLMIGAMSLESFGQRMKQYQPEKLIVVVGDRLEIQERAIRDGVRALVVSGGLPVSQAIEDFARKHQVTLRFRRTTRPRRQCSAARPFRCST